MNKTEVCIFCHYRKTSIRAGGQGSCCAGDELARARTESAGKADAVPGRAIPERARPGTIPPHQPR